MLGPTFPLKSGPECGFESVLHHFLAWWLGTHDSACLISNFAGFLTCKMGSTHLADFSGSHVTVLCKQTQGSSLG